MHIINCQHKNIDTMQFIYRGLKPKCTSVHGVCRTDKVLSSTPSTDIQNSGADVFSGTKNIIVNCNYE